MSDDLDRDERVDGARDHASGRGDAYASDAALQETVSVRVRAHVHDCRDCAEHALVLDTVGALLARMPAPHPAASLCARVLVAAAPMLAANAAAAYRRRLVSGVALSLAPFPLLVFFNLYLLREAYSLLSTWLPVQLVAWLVVGYAAMLLLICALTYASLPLLIARARLQAPPREALGEGALA